MNKKLDWHQDFKRKMKLRIELAVVKFFIFIQEEPNPTREKVQAWVSDFVEEQFEVKEEKIKPL